MKSESEGDKLKFEEEQIISVIKLMGLDLPSRKELKIDYKTYLIPLLYFRHEFSKNQIAAIFNMDHSSINHHKKRRQRLEHNQDNKFLKNILPLKSSFPYEFPRIEDYDMESRLEKSTLILSIGKTRRLKLDSYAKEHDLDSPQAVIRRLIDNNL